MIYCPNCNRPSTGKKQTCPHCGARLHDAQERKPAEKPAEKPARKAPSGRVEVKKSEKPAAEKAPTKPKKEAKRLGEILIAAGMLTEDQLQAALARQRKLGIRLGSILIKEKIISESQLVQALSHQADLPWVDLWNIDIPGEISRTVPLSLVQKYRFVPMDIQTGADGGKLLYLAMDSAGDVEAIQAAASASGMRIVPMFAALSAIVASIRTLYADQLSVAVTEAPVVNVTSRPEKKSRKPGWETLPYVDESVLRQPIVRAAEEPPARPGDRTSEAAPPTAPKRVSEETWEFGPGEGKGGASKKRALRVMTLLDGTEIRWEDQAKAGFVVDAEQEARVSQIRALAGSAEEAGRLQDYLLAVVELLLQKNLISSEELLNKLKKAGGGPKKGG